MTINELINQLPSIDDDLVCFSQRPITLNSQVFLYTQEEANDNNKSLNGDYFLEIFIIKEIIQLINSRHKTLSDKKRIEALDYYSVKDSYPEWIL